MRMPQHRRALALALTLATIGLLLLPTGPAFAREPKLKVVTTVAPHADLVRQIAGDRVDLVQMIPDGSDSHTFEPRPSDATFLQAADLIVLNGLHLETPTQRPGNGSLHARTSDRGSCPTFAQRALTASQSARAPDGIFHPPGCHADPRREIAMRQAHRRMPSSSGWIPVGHWRTARAPGQCPHLGAGP